MVADKGQIESSSKEDPHQRHKDHERECQQEPIHDTRQPTNNVSRQDKWAKSTTRENAIEE
jgi:hypothetical protein